MKILKQASFGTPTLGLSVVKLIEVGDGRFEVKQRQGTGGKSYYPETLEKAETIFEGVCAYEEMTQGKFDESTWRKK